MATQISAREFFNRPKTPEKRRALWRLAAAETGITGSTLRDHMEYGKRLSPKTAARLEAWNPKISAKKTLEWALARAAK